MTRRVLVTGVSSGIGLAQASLFLEKGYQVYGVDKARKPNLTGDFHFLQLDLTDELSPLFDWLADVDIICNTAGILDDYRPLLGQSDAQMQEIFAVNLFAPSKICRHYLPAMLERKSGIIINMCSIASFLAGGGGSSYTASKHALAGFTKQLAFDFGSQGVKVNILSPGFIETSMTDGIDDERLNRIPAQRAGKPEEIAALAVFLASDDSNYMHGSNVFMDGGWVLGRK